MYLKDFIWYTVQPAERVVIGFHVIIYKKKKKKNVISAFQKALQNYVSRKYVLDKSI